MVEILESQTINTGTFLAPLNWNKAVTERLPHTLEVAPQLSYGESLYVLERSLEGFEFLYKQGGEPFAVNSKMIAFTP